MERIYPKLIGRIAENKLTAAQERIVAQRSDK